MKNKKADPAIKISFLIADARLVWLRCDACDVATQLGYRFLAFDPQTH